MCCTAAARTADVAAPIGRACARDEGDLAEDWLATLVRDTLHAATGGAEPPKTTWAAIQRRLEEERT